jgi:hypothetical protein
MTALRRVLFVAPVALAVLVAACPAVAARPAETFRVTVEFRQTRTWNHNHQQVSPECLESVHMAASGLLTVTSGRGVAGFGMRGIHERGGTSVVSSAGESCAGPDQVAPNSGCGTRDIRSVFPTLTLRDNRLRLRFGTQGAPDFAPCPFFEGASEGEGLPGAEYRDITAILSATELRRARKGRGRAAKVSRISRTESCASLAQACPEGVSYDAGATVETIIIVNLVPRRR